MPETILAAALIGLALAATAFIIVAAGYIVARGAKEWSLALAAQHNARGLAIQADDAQAAVDQARAAIDEADVPAPRAEYRPPSDDEIFASILAERRAHTNGAPPPSADSVREYDTLGNEGIDPSAPGTFPDGGMYRPAT